jgi:cytochrome c553
VRVRVAALTAVLIAAMLAPLAGGADDPSWAYGFPPVASFPPPPPPPPARRGGPPPGAAAAANPGRGPDTTELRATGATRTFTRTQVNDGFGPADWFPEDHPVMPEVVAHGKPPQARACALCHLPTGKGRPENAPVAGLPYDYILQQLNDFRNGLRTSADPRKDNTPAMIDIAKALTEDEMKVAAKYFSSMPWSKWIRVVEAEQIPTMRLNGSIFYRVDDGTTEPIGNRIVESPEDTAQAQMRNPRSGFIAYVPPGSVKKGEALVKTGGNGKTTACGVCHGPDLKGLGPIPGLAGRSPSYLVRQIYDMKQGTRKGAMSALMQPVIANLTQEDIVSAVAYLSSLTP